MQTAYFDLCLHAMESGVGKQASGSEGADPSHAGFSPMTSCTPVTSQSSCHCLMPSPWRTNNTGSGQIRTTRVSGAESSTSCLPCALVPWEVPRASSQNRKEQVCSADGSTQPAATIREWTGATSPPSSGVDFGRFPFGFCHLAPALPTECQC